MNDTHTFMTARATGLWQESERQLEIENGEMKKSPGNFSSARV